MSVKKAGTKKTMRQRFEDMKQKFGILKGRMDGLETNINGLIERIKQEFMSSVESLKTLIIRAELSSASSQMMARGLSNCQTEVDSLFYLLNELDPEKFSMENLRKMTMRVQHAKVCGPAIDVACGFFGRALSPMAPVCFKAEPQEEEKIESGDGESESSGPEQIPA